MNENSDYKWQKDASRLWEENGRCGVIKTVPGAGKTRAGQRIIEYVRETEPDAVIVVVCPTKALIYQWKRILNDHSIHVVSYFYAVKLVNGGFKTDLLILDECHSIMSPKRGEVMDMNYKYILGLSATPMDSECIIGKILIDIPWKQAKVAKFDVHYETFEMTNFQLSQYYQLSRQVSIAVRQFEKGDIDREMFMNIIMKRRSYVYELPQRIGFALALAYQHQDDRIIMFCERLSQIKEISKCLKIMELKHSILTSKQDTFERFLDHETNILLSSKMLKEGFDDPSTNIGIVVSTPLSERNHVQTIGRIVRYEENKHAKIYVLLADETTDVTLGLKKIAYGKKFSMDTKGEIFVKFKGKRMYAITRHPGIIEMMSPNGGRFFVNSDGEVRAYTKNEWKKIGIYNEGIEINYK